VPDVATTRRARDSIKAHARFERGFSRARERLTLLEPLLQPLLEPSAGLQARCLGALPATFSWFLLAVAVAVAVAGASATRGEPAEAG